MKGLILTLLVLSFLQTTLIPLNLVLVVLLVRAFMLNDQHNLFLAFGFGLLVGLLSTQNMGVISLLYMISIILVQLAKRTRLTANWLTVLPLCATIFLLNQLAFNIFSSQSINWLILLWQAALVLPSYWLINLLTS